MTIEEGRGRAVISNIQPVVECGRFSVKRIVGDTVVVTADIFTDGHSLVSADLLYKKDHQDEWLKVPMEYIDNDRWKGHFQVTDIGRYLYTVHAWVNYFKTWQQEISKKFASGMDISSEMKMGLKMMEQALSRKAQPELKQFYDQIKHSDSGEEQAKLATDAHLSLLMRDVYPNKHWVTEIAQVYSITVDPIKAGFSTWYELFPRSFSKEPGQHGTFKDALDVLPKLNQMGFDVLYLPPIHPIGFSKRKGKRNTPEAKEQDPGSPWAIGSSKGGHKAIHPELGTMADFEAFVKEARRLGISIALDVAFQCSPDHPYLKEHPSWFRWRPDGTIQYAENPPKKYEDIVPFCFETDDWQELWEELRSVFIFWIEKGVRIFRVDNPHTKPFPFWEWLITTVKEKYPDIIFLAEAFTRPKVMYRLAKLGFTQSYTYFTWRHTKRELTEYLTEIVLTDVKEFFRPNFWTNTPDILTEELQRGGKATFYIRLILAATLTSNYGMYGPAFELIENEAIPGTEEYLNSEKYQLRSWPEQKDDSLVEAITQINQIRKSYPALQQTSNLRFLNIDNDQILYYSKHSQDPLHVLLIVVNLDPYNPQSGTLHIPLKDFNISEDASFRVHELLSDRYYIWEGPTQAIYLDQKTPCCIFSIQSRVKRELDFEYFL